MSVIEVDGMTMANSIFRSNQGHAAGHLEPDEARQKITNLQIQYSKFLENAGGGILIAGKKGQISNVEITHNLILRTRPIVLEDAPAVQDATICRNRQIVPQSEPSAGLTSYEDPAAMVITQDDCGDRRMMTRRGKKKS